MNSRPKYPITTLALLLLLVSTCSNLQSVFSEQAYRQAVSLKVESLELIKHATESFPEYENRAVGLKTELQKAYEYARGRPDNEISSRQWEILIDPKRNLLGGFLARWEQEENLSPVLVSESVKIISDAFDTIIQLESGKRKAAEPE